MEPKFTSSFIPKRSLEKVAKGGRTSAVAIVPLISLIIFLTAVALSVGVFLYEQFLIQNINKKEQDLEAAREVLRSPLIDELIRLDARLTAARAVLGNHLVLTAFFNLLEEKTLSNVRFTNFSYEAKDDGTISVSMNGVARSFNAVAVQSEVFGDDRLIKNPLFSNLNVDQNGNVVFTFTASVDPRLLSYTLAVSAPTQESNNQNVEE
jgi:hypothetical protein